MPISLVLNVIIAVLLLLTIAYAARLNHRLSQLRNDKNELQKLAKTFADATARAEASIKQLKISSQALTNEVNRAEALKDDLAYLVERGGRTADEMVANVRGGTGGPGGRGQAASQQPQDEESRLIEEAIRAATPQAGGGDEMDQPTTRRISGRHPTRAPERGVETAGSPAGRRREADDPETIGDSDAARELLKALNSVK